MNEDKTKAVVEFVCKHPGKDPVEAARARLEEIDLELHNINEKIVLLRREKQVCSDVLGRFGERKKPDRTPAPPVDLDDDSEENVETRDKIVALLDESERVTKQEIVRGAGGYGNETRINRMLKYLGDRGIIAIDNDEWIKGPKFGENDGEASGG